MAAGAIRTLTGPIKIRQEPIPGQKVGSRWIATFSPDLLRLLRQLAHDKDYPDSVVLANAELPEPETVEVGIEKVFKYEQIAPEFKQMRDNGASVQSIASAHGMSWDYANEILHFAETGERPKWKKGKGTGNGAKPTKYIEISKEVAYLRDKKNMAFKKIAAKLGVGDNTVRRAYDHEHQDDIREAVKRGDKPNRGRYRHLGPDVYK